MLIFSATQHKFNEVLKVQINILSYYAVDSTRRVIIVTVINFKNTGSASGIGNKFSGQVVGETAKALSARFGKVLQKHQSITINRNDKSTSISTQFDNLIPASKISILTQGMFVGAVSDNFNERIEQNIFHAEIVVDNDKAASETKAYKKIPQILSFTDENGKDTMKQEIQKNCKQIKEDITFLIEDEINRIANDPYLQHLINETQSPPHEN